MRHFTLVCDENIVALEDLLEGISNARFSVIKKAGRAINAEDVKHADILLCRSVTHLNKNLLADSAVKFAGSATAGLDHVDQDFLAQQNIHFCAAPGANANAVAEYVICAINEMCLQRGEDFFSKKIAIVGHGHVGSCLENKLRSFDANILLYDPFLAKSRPENYCSWEAIFECDVISFHVPYTREGEYPTSHMLNEKFFSSLKSNTLLINAARGEICNEANLLRYKDKKNIACIWDVWKNEPDISKALLEAVEIGTPHIAGYSLDAKLNATRILVEQFSNFFGLDFNDKPSFESVFPITGNSLSEILLKVYQPSIDNETLKTAFVRQGAAAFDLLRKNYAHRYEFSHYQIQSKNLTQKECHILKNLGFVVE